MSKYHDKLIENENWKALAAYQASIICSLLVTRNIEPGTFGEQWLEEAHNAYDATWEALYDPLER